MGEAVRLVVWDLDETFWRGTVTEGGISDYVQAHHDIVIELANRGIISSICSKNDPSVILPILEKYGIREYFVFPSISWEAKGLRLAQMAEDVQLRPATIMFIDDNPGNRAEAAAVVPGLQVEDESFIPRLLADPRFAGKPDAELTRLRQYQLLETRAQDKAKSSDNNSEFLRSCNIRIRVEYDIETNIDRAVELVNRTNQLNFTKRRLPKETGAAREALLAEVNDVGHQAGLIHVADKYGDYGYVGFFIVRNSRDNPNRDDAMQRLQHFCFSCRTLGMLVEKWVYEWLRRPQLTVVGEVLTDVFAPLAIDWITMVDNFDHEAGGQKILAPEIRIHGGCEANAIAHFLSRWTPSLKVSGNFRAGSFFVRQNSAELLLKSMSYTEEFVEDMKAFGIPGDLIRNDFFGSAQPGTVFVVSPGLDARHTAPVVHKTKKWLLHFEFSSLGNTKDLFTMSHKDIHEAIDRTNRDPEKAAEQHRMVDNLRQTYRLAPPRSKTRRQLHLMKLLKKVPIGGRLVLVLDADCVRSVDGKTVTQPVWLAEFHKMVRGIAAPFGFIQIVSMGEQIKDIGEILSGGNHYARMVFFRTSEAIGSAIAATQAKTQTDQRKLHGMIAALAQVELAEAGTKQPDAIRGTAKPRHAP